MSAASTLAAKANKMLKHSPDLTYAMAVDDTSHAGQVLLAVARRARHSCVLVIPASSWNPIAAARVVSAALDQFQP